MAIDFTATEPKRIECGSQDMVSLFCDGCKDYYQPTLGGHDIGKPEAGITSVSLANLRALSESIQRAAWAVRFGKGFTCLFDFTPDVQYVATGFAWGYGGTGPCGLAEILHYFGFGHLDDLRSRVMNLADDFMGVWQR